MPARINRRHDKEKETLIYCTFDMRRAHTRRTLQFRLKDIRLSLYEFDLLNMREWCPDDPSFSDHTYNQLLF